MEDAEASVGVSTRVRIVRDASNTCECVIPAGAMHLLAPSDEAPGKLCFSSVLERVAMEDAGDAVFWRPVASSQESLVFPVF